MGEGRDFNWEIELTKFVVLEVSKRWEVITATH